VMNSWLGLIVALTILWAAVSMRGGWAFPGLDQGRLKHLGRDGGMCHSRPGQIPYQSANFGLVGPSLWRAPVAWCLARLAGKADVHRGL